MNMYEIITKKKHKETLSEAEIRFWVKGLTSGEIPDYQTSALLMAICLNGMNDEETWILTDAMTHSGDVLNLDKIEGIKVDKHSTGGVGDKTTLVLAPMLAACGLKVAKLSGRGLGHTGGTIDKLESIKGFNVSLTDDEFIDNVNNCGVAVAAQTAEVAPADKKLYALRDVTATVDNVSLITSSIMSKKLASGADCLVLDVKTGSGSFMNTVENARELAEKMVSIGKKANRKVSAVISDMNQPLGYAVGNALEVKEAIATLQGNGAEDLRNLCIVLGSQLLLNAGIADDIDAARSKMQAVLDDKSALEKFKEFVAAQGGDISVIEDTDKLPKANLSKEVLSDKEGYISKIACSEVGMASLYSGAGRATKEDTIDFGAGIIVKAKIGDYVKKGESIATVYSSDEDKLNSACEKLLAAYEISKEKPAEQVLIYGVIN